METEKQLFVLVSGGRHYSEQSVVSFFLSKIKQKINFTLIHGNAKGADTLASNWCKQNPDIKEIKFPANWEQYGKYAGIQRNITMARFLLDQRALDSYIMALIFPGNTGTAHMKKMCIDCDIPFVEIKNDTKI